MRHRHDWLLTSPGHPSGCPCQQCADYDLAAAIEDAEEDERAESLLPEDSRDTEC